MRLKYWLRCTMIGGRSELEKRGQLHNGQMHLVKLSDEVVGYDKRLVREACIEAAVRYLISNRAEHA